MQKLETCLELPQIQASVQAKRVYVSNCVVMCG